MGIINEDFQMEGKECKDHNRLKIRSRAREVLQFWVGDFLWVGCGGKGEVGSSHKKFSKGERKLGRGMRLLGAGCPLVLRQLASGSTAQGLRL